MGNQLNQKQNKIPVTKDISTAKYSSDYRLFMRHIRNNRHITLDQQRLVFISVIGLYQTWNMVPPLSLYTSLCLLPLKRDWIYRPKKYKTQLRSTLIGTHNIFSDKDGYKQFVSLLKWKDSQGLVIWIYDYIEHYPSIHPFWYALNEKLCKLSDPVSNIKYKPLNFDDGWFDSNRFKSKYDTTASSIWIELRLLPLKYDAVKEIIYQSNPKTLLPITAYHSTALRSFVSSTKWIDNDFDIVNDEEWVVLSDYDPFDI